MNLNLVPDWQAVLKKAWTIKYSMLAAALGVLELVVPLVPQITEVTGVLPKGTFIGASVILNVFIIPYVRILSQQEIVNAAQPTPKTNDINYL